MGVSRTPVREAIRMLEQKGLVQIIPNKGAVVLGISEKDLKDIYTIPNKGCATGYILCPYPRNLRLCRHL